jgi:hypothetical protein
MTNLHQPTALPVDETAAAEAVMKAGYFTRKRDG